jgi:hypothetical protein
MYPQTSIPRLMGFKALNDLDFVHTGHFPIKIVSWAYKNIIISGRCL